MSATIDFSTEAQLVEALLNRRVDADRQLRVLVLLTFQHCPYRAIARERWSELSASFLRQQLLEQGEHKGTTTTSSSSNDKPATTTAPPTVVCASCTLEDALLDHSLQTLLRLSEKLEDVTSPSCCVLECSYNDNKPDESPSIVLKRCGGAGGVPLAVFEDDKEHFLPLAIRRLLEK